MATAFNLDTVLGAFLASILILICGVVGAAFVARFFNAFVVGASAISGATMAVAGVHHLLPSLGLFDLASGDFLPRALTLLLAVLGVIWQAQNIGKWAQMLPLNDGSPDSSNR